MGLQSRSHLVVGPREITPPCPCLHTSPLSVQKEPSAVAPETEPLSVVLAGRQVGLTNDGLDTTDL